jgi:hypothetical protein
MGRVALLEADVRDSRRQSFEPVSPPAQSRDLAKDIGNERGRHENRQLTSFVLESRGPCG